MESQIEMNFPAARKSDPDTSHMAGMSVRVRSGSQQWQLLKAYSEHPLLGLTDEEAGVATGLDKLPRCCYWKRCSELRAMGYIRASAEEKRRSSAGELQQVSRITAEGWQVVLRV